MCFETFNYLIKGNLMLSLMTLCRLLCVRSCGISCFQSYCYC